MTTVDFAQARRAYEWLDHHRLPESYTELVALHPDYRPGKEYYERNKTRDLFPKTRYAQTPRDLESFVISYADSRMVCIGLNPRPKAFRDTNGYVRGARETEIAISTACLWDFDFADQAGRDAFRTRFLPKARSFFLDRGFLPPQESDSGRGEHFLLAYPPITVAESPDIKYRLQAFQREFARAYHQEIGNLGARLDSSTLDLRRVVRVPGTAKPQVGLLSRLRDFRPRHDDERLREYLLSLRVATPERSEVGDFVVRAVLPAWFPELLARHDDLQSLWAGRGKHNGDQSRSGYDFSLVRRLINLGYQDNSDLATILALRPDGSVKHAGKGHAYLRNTLIAARSGTKTEES